MDLESIARQLGGAKKTPAGYLCVCPCHDDSAKRPSLSIAEGKNGRVVVNCLAGCGWKDIKTKLQSLGLESPLMKRRDRYEGAKFYVYYDLVGNALCRKVKLPDKTMWFERYDAGSWVAGLAGMRVPLYNIAAVVKSDLVYLCEGEKDAETLIARGLVATTNHAGAKSWAPHLTEQLAGKTVILIPDNDKPGKERVAKLSRALQGVVKELRVFIPDGVPEHGDITDWVNAGGDAAQILPKSISVEKSSQSKKACREDYYQLFEQVLGGPRRCVFNEKLMYYDPATGLWNPAVNAIDIIKSEALVANETREAKFSINNITPHFFAYEASKTPEFLVDIPAWDHIDRISEMAYLMKLKPDAGIEPCAFSELLKEWCALVFKRLHNPMVQNRILVLQGGQGIGKDTWISMLVDGLGQFSIPLAVVKEDKDTYLNLHRGLVMKISEFDKTAKTEVSTLKDIITAPSTNLRAPYDKDSRLRLSRCSFISSANAEHLLRDSTGNRRFLIFELESIEYAYAGWSAEKIKEWQMQCLAQMAHMAEIDYTASGDSWRQMQDYIERQTPSDATEDMLEGFLAACKESLHYQKGVEITPSERWVAEIIAGLAKQTGVSFRGIKTMLEQKIGVRKRVGLKRYRVWRLPSEESKTAEIEQSFQNQMPF